MKDIVPLKRRDSVIAVEAMKSRTGCHAVVWNAPKMCDEDRCFIVKRCEARSNGDVCRLHKQYLESVYTSAMDMLGVGITTREAVRLGMHIIPLYSILFEMKLAVSASSVFCTNMKGGVGINPIFREIREQIKCIDDMWGKLGYRELVGHATEGDADYCENLFSEQ